MSGSKKTDRPYGERGQHHDWNTINNNTTDLVAKEATNKKPAKTKVWIQKAPQKNLFNLGDAHENDNLLGFMEVIAGEWQRFMNDNQPKTRLREVNGQIKVLSERLSEYISFENIVNESKILLDGEELSGTEIMRRIYSGKIPGLGDCAVSLLTTMNGDGHFGNIGIAKNKEGERVVCLIDAGLCYWPIHYLLPKKYEQDPRAQVIPLKEGDVKDFPFFTNNELICNNFYNFLDIIKKEKLNPLSVTPLTLRNEPAFLDEKHARMLKEILMPDGFVEDFMLKYTIPDYAIKVSHEELKDRAKLCAEVHNERKNNLKAVALKDPRFCEYLKTEKAQKVVDVHANRMSDFVVYGKEKLFDRAARYLPRSTITNNYYNLRDEVTAQKKPILHSDSAQQGALQQGVRQPLVVGKLPTGKPPKAPRV